MDDMKLENKILISKYNNENDVVRCPRGRAKFKEQLDEFTYVSTVLYGVIKLDDLTRIYNEVYDGDLEVFEVQAMLLPLILKNGGYYFYEDFVIEESFAYDLDQVAGFYQEQSGKDFYVPSKDEYDDFNDLMYCGYDEPFMNELSLVIEDEMDLFVTVSFIKQLIIRNYDMSTILKFLADKVDDVSYFEKNNSLIDLLIEMMNNTRLAINRGHTPNELRKQESVMKPQVTSFQEVKRNDPCPCGSGKKYKKCCLNNYVSNNDCLNLQQKVVFYNVWYDLLTFINKKYNIFPNKKVPNLNDEKLFELRSLLWEDRSVINEYIKSDESLSDYAIDILKEWQEKAIEGNFIVIDHNHNGAVISAVDNRDDDTINFYEVKGMNNSIAKVLKNKKHICINTVLLPFVDAIVYDTFIGEQNINMSQTVVDAFEVEYETQLKNNSIFKNL